MNRALFFLLWRSLRGRVWQILRRLRQPRYLIGATVGIGWVLFWFGRWFLRLADGSRDVSIQMGAPPQLVAALAGPLGTVAQLLVGVVLMLALSLWWLIPLGKNSLQLSEAELHLLLPAPMKRRQIIQYAILRSQPGVMFGAAIVTFFSGARSLPAGLAAFAGLWVFFSLWDLHGTARGLWLANLAHVPAATAWRRRLLAWAVIVAVWIALVAGVTQIVTAILLDPPDLSALRSLGDSDDVDVGALEALRPEIEPLVEIVRGSLLWLVVTPIIWLTAPFFLGLTGAGTWEVLAAWFVPVLALAAHNEWIVRSQSRFEEAAMAAAKQRTRKADPAAKYWRRSRRSRRWHPFRLSASATPEIAVLWKNLMLVQRAPLTLTMGVGVALFILVASVTGSGLGPARLAAVLLVAGVGLMLAPPLLSARGMRNDLRTDLLRLEMVRPWPLAPVRMFLAQIAAPVLLTMLQVIYGAFLLLATDLLLLGGVLSFENSLADWLAAGLAVPRPLLVPLVIAGYLPVALVVATLTAALENMAALLFPGWVQLGLDRRQAASQFGHHIIIFMALSLAMFFALLPGVLAAGGFVAVQILIWGVPLNGWELPLIGLLAAAPVGAVIFAIAGLSGGLWSRLDPSQELLAGG